MGDEIEKIIDDHLKAPVIEGQELASAIPYRGVDVQKKMFWEIFEGVIGALMSAKPKDYSYSSIKMADMDEVEKFLKDYAKREIYKNDL